MKAIIRTCALSTYLTLASAISPLVFASDVPVSASVAEQSYNPPTLISPANNATVNIARPTLSWSRPSPAPASPLNHYDLYLDDSIFASSLSDSLTSVDFYFYSATASGGVFYLTFKTDQTQGYHTWKVVAYNDAGVSSGSETRTFYLDSIAPYISVTNVDKTILTWTTSNSTTIPDVQNRYLTVTTANPVLKGGVEASSNFQIILVCPTNIPSCNNITYSTNASSGLWEQQLSNLLAGYIYTLKLSATDAAGNITLFPDFFITLPTTTTPTHTPRPTTTAATTPTASLTPLPPLPITPFPGLPLPSFTVTPPAGLMVVITPGSDSYKPPSAPTPPPPKRAEAKVSIDVFYAFLMVLIILGLPLHLLMSLVGTRTPFLFSPKFLFILAYPFLRKKTYRTIPFTFIQMFASDNLNKSWQMTVSDIQGFYHLKSPIPNIIFIRLTSFAHKWKDILAKGTLLPISCLFLIPIGSLEGRERLVRAIYDSRIVPLLIACLTSITVLIIWPSYPVLIYAYFSLQYLFSEYLYPRINKKEE